MKHKINIGLSSCPNDTFIFDALINNRIDTGGIEFVPYIGDVEELNQKAFRSELHVTKISFFAYIQLVKNYVLLDSGSALGRKNGPLLIAREKIPLAELQNCSCAIPGENTTANLLLSLFCPQLEKKKPLLFSDIEEAVLTADVDTGLIIHENRFTYREKGLVCLRDLGDWWEEEAGSPIPLGGIIARRDMPKDLLLRINQLLYESVRYAFDNPEASFNFVKKFAQDMREDIIRKHIDLYVNDFSLKLGDEGRKAIEMLFRQAAKSGKGPEDYPDLFI